MKIQLSNEDLWLIIYILLLTVFNFGFIIHIAGLPLATTIIMCLVPIATAAVAVIINRKK